MKNTSLPIEPVLAELLQTVAGSPNTVLQAPPGAGKTTRVPLALLDLAEIGAGRIVMLEPRRLAAVNAANRMAATLGEEVGGTVGYTMRFERRVSPGTRIEVVTEGILTRRLQRDPCLEGVSLVIFDEFHERSLNADLSLALCLEVQREVRPDLKILVMSATLDCGPVAALLGNAPVVVSAGRSFPVEVRWLEDPGHLSIPVRMAAAVQRALGETHGDILAFLPGAGEIRACGELLREKLPGQSPAIHPLYGDLPFAEQQQAILAGPQRKLVLATNIAETSLTIEGVSVVIDSGLSRAVRHDVSTGMNRLLTVRESRASAEQRTGRAGRLAPGVCYRLFGRHTFNAMTAFTPAEILVSDLSALILELAVWGVRDPASLAWLDPPPAAAVAGARELLGSLGALDKEGRATETGRQMAELPVHPRIARMLLLGRELGVVGPAAGLAALLAERDIFRYGPGEVAPLCESDLLERHEAIAERGLRRDERVQVVAVRAVERTAAQLLRLMGKRDTGQVKAFAGEGETAARLLLAAYPDRVARQREEGSERYLLANGRGARLSRKSGVRGRSWILAVQVDAGEKGEGLIHQACSLAPELIRSECRDRVVTKRRVSWDASQERVLGWEEEVLGAVSLSRRQVVPSDDEAIPLLVAVIGDSRLAFLNWDREACRFRGRVRLVREAFPAEEWPDLGDERLLATLPEWLAPFLFGVRSRRDISGLDVTAALRALFTREQVRQLEERAPTHITVPSGSRIEIDYVSGDEPLLPVKLQEMFGCADTPAIAGGRVKLLLHLLSPARRPVQVTRDLKGFWESGYREVKRELKGRYPKHPWPDDPWNAVPTAKTTRAMRGKPA
jgi:ATP-dependent helicase HrpB